jgi:hypothetical protein
MGDLAEETLAGRNLRREMSRWFPSSTWAREFEHPLVRAGVREKRRDFLFKLTASAGLFVPGISACSGAEAAAIAGVVFQAIKVAKSKYSAGSEAGGSAFFDSDSQSREKAQLGTQLMLAHTNEVQDEHEELVQVPPKKDNWAYAFEGLVSQLTGDHQISGIAAGVELLTEVFAFI